MSLNFLCPFFQNDCHLTEIVITQPETQVFFILDSIVIQFWFLQPPYIRVTILLISWEVL